MSSIYQSTVAHQSATSNKGANPVQLVDDQGVPMAEHNQDSIILLASGAVTANASSTVQTNQNCRGLLLFIKTGAFGASESTMTVTIQGVDPISTSTWNILVSASLSANAFVILRVYPGLTAAANVTASDVLPKSWQVSWAASNWGTGGSVLGIAACTMV